MKRLFKTTLLLLLVLATLTAVAACKKDDGMRTYDSAGLKFTLPKDMKEANVTYADLCYANGECEFFIYFYTNTELLTVLYIDKNSTVLEYADWFVNVANKDRYPHIESEYDEERGVLRQWYVYEPDGENTFYYDYIVRTDTNLYHVTMSCDGEDKEKYKPIFDEWATYIELTPVSQ